MAKALAGLNAAQSAAVQNPAKVLQVLAPPGSGKTKTLTARVAYLINNEKLAPCNTIVCTFTVKAAREMKERLKGLVGEGVESQLILGTFHSVARRFLVRYGQLIDIPRKFGIADTSDSVAILKRIIKRQKIQLLPAKAHSRISRMKAQGKGPEECKPKKGNDEVEEFAQVYSEYEQLLKRSNLLDFDDLLLRCRELLQTRPTCVSRVNAVLIDEFQDTNYIQYDLMKLFAQESNNITVVGDPDQSIYSFRSAEIKNLLQMRQDYPETVTVALEENYRSSGSILLTAMEVIEQDMSRPAKRILPTHCTGVQPVLHKTDTDHEEAYWIASEIEYSRAFTGNLLRYDDYAILLRSASLSRQIEAALGRSGIPYRMVGGLRFFDRAEVKLVLDYMRVIDQPGHSEAIARIVNVPSRKVGEVTMKKLINAAEEKKTTLWSLLIKVSQGSYTNEVSSQAHNGIQRFVRLIKTFQKKLADTDEPSFDLAQFINDLLEEIELKEYLKKHNAAEEYEGRWGNVQELVAQASDTAEAVRKQALEDNLPDYEEIAQSQMVANIDLLACFLSNIALSTEIVKKDDNSSEIGKVTISTIHAAKGLEWPVVFIPSVYDGSIPHSRAEDYDEERRLLYVGMTRAKVLLYISHPLKKGNRKKGDDEKGNGNYEEPYRVSPFLSERSIQPYFTTHNPLDSFTLVQDLARILGRKCPTRMKVAAAASAHRTRVDEHTKDKRVKIHGCSGNNNGKYALNNARKRQMNNFSSPHLSVSRLTTMQNPGTYSISSTTIPSNFVSARTCMTSSVSNCEGINSIDNGSAKSNKKIKSEKSCPTKPTHTGSIGKFFKPVPAPTSATLAGKISTLSQASSLKPPSPSSAADSTRKSSTTTAYNAVKPHTVHSSSAPSFQTSVKLANHQPTIYPSDRLPRVNRNRNPAFKCPIKPRYDSNTRSVGSSDAGNNVPFWDTNLTTTTTTATITSTSTNTAVVARYGSAHHPTSESTSRSALPQKRSTGPLNEIWNTVPGSGLGNGENGALKREYMSKI